jgi:hypothetical protein
MATRSTIAVQHADGTISQVYCHWDGYLDHNGVMLIQNYNTLAKVEELLSYGDISSLRPQIHPDLMGGSHIFKDLDSRQNEVCVFYGRDRQETGIEPRKFSDWAEFQKNCMGEEYNYVFQDGVWYVSGDYYNDDTDESIEYTNAILTEQMERQGIVFVVGA